MVGLVFSWRKSSKTVLLHFGHLGSSSESMTYIKHLGQPTSTMDVASGLFEYRRLSSWLSSDDTHELGGDVGDTVADRLGDSANGLALGGERFSFKSSFGPLPFLRLMMSLTSIYRYASNFYNILKTVIQWQNIDEKQIWKMKKNCTIKSIIYSRKKQGHVVYIIVSTLKL